MLKVLNYFFFLNDKAKIDNNTQSILVGFNTNEKNYLFLTFESTF